MNAYDIEAYVALVPEFRVSIAILSKKYGFSLADVPFQPATIALHSQISDLHAA